MICRRLSFPLACAALVCAALIALPAASASAASSKVLLVTRGEEGSGPPAAQGETAHITQFVKWSGLQAECGGADEAATVGKNPSGTVKVAGSNVPISSSCVSESTFQPLPGAITIKSVSVNKSGAVKLSGKISITVGECTYRATKLTGTQQFEGAEAERQFSEFLSGTAKLMGHSASSCAATTTVEDGIGVGNAEGYNYLVELTS